MIEYVQFRIEGISFYRAIVQGSKQTLVAASEIGQGRAELMVKMARGEARKDQRHLSVLELRDKVVVENEVYYLLDPITLYEPIKPLELTELLQMMLSIIDIYQEIKRVSKAQQMRPALTPDNLLMRISDKKVLLSSICCTEKFISDEVEKDNLLNIVSFLSRLRKGRSEQSMSFHENMRQCRSLEECRRFVAGLLHSQPRRIRTEATRNHTHRIRTGNDEHNVIDCQSLSNISKCRSVKSLGKQNHQRSTQKRRTHNVTPGSSSRRREVLGEFSRSPPATGQETPCFPNKQTTVPKLKKRSIQTLSLMSMVRMSRQNRPGDSARIPWHTTTPPFFENNPKQFTVRRKSKLIQEELGKLHTQTHRVPVTVTTRHLQTATDEAAVDLEDIVLEERWNHIQQQDLPPPDSTNKQQPPAELEDKANENFSVSTDRNCELNENMDTQKHPPNNQPRTISTLSLHQQLQQFEQAIFGKYNRIGQFATSAASIFRPLRLPWQLPIFLLYRWFAQVRVCLLECLTNRQNLLAVDNWLNIAKSQAYSSWLVRLSNDNDGILQAVGRLQHKLTATTVRNRKEILELNDASNQSFRNLFLTNRELYRRLKHRALEISCLSTLKILCQLAYCLLLACGIELQQCAAANRTLAATQKYLELVEQHLNKLQIAMENT